MKIPTQCVARSTILITGGTSGFGRAVALELAALGWHVFACGRNDEWGRAVVGKCRGPGIITYVPLDVTDGTSIGRAVATVLETATGRLDVLMNNAGSSTLGAFEDIPDQTCRREMETNFFGALAVTRAVLPAMRRAGRGRIVIVTSNAVNAPHPLLTMYAASKWALEGWAEGLAMEVEPFGIDIAVVQPGAHRTPFARAVTMIRPEEGAYERYWQITLPGIMKLDRWGRDPAKATRSLVDAVVQRHPGLRRSVGPDTITFRLMKGLLPYGARSWLLRRIVGLPRRDAFRDRSEIGSDASNP